MSVRDLSGPLIPESTRTVPDTEISDRSLINAWQNGALGAAVEATGRRRLLMAGLWTEACLTLPALSDRSGAGYEVFAVVDASAGSSTAAHEAAIIRMSQRGVVPVSSASVLSELRRDRARSETYHAVMDVVATTWAPGDRASIISGRLCSRPPPSDSSR
ncbi:isochorismatase family protein [Streptomyces mirabilis]